MNLTELKEKPINELVEMAEAMGIENVARSRKQDVIFALLKRHAEQYGYTFCWCARHGVFYSRERYCGCVNRGGPYEDCLKILGYRSFSSGS